MNGVILGIDQQKAAGALRADDGRRYFFRLSEWKGIGSPTPNTRVDFELENELAVGVFPLAAGVPPPVPPAAAVTLKSRTTAALLALLLGGFGAHKFYLGNWGWGIVHVVFCWTYIPAAVALAEAIRYFTLSDADFERKHAAAKEPLDFLW